MRSLLLLLGAALAAPPLAAQAAAPRDSERLVVTPRDSARLNRLARSEQNRFEYTRRHNLPWAWGGGSGTCDERIGRFCLTYGDDDEDPWEAPPEPEEIGRARGRLLERLDSVARAIPGDPWVSGQRVRYLVEARRFDDALAAARECRAAAWWCDALQGYAEHFSGRALAADSAFDASLGAMPEEVRKRWTDLSPILDGCAAGYYRRLRGEERARFESRFWRLADPFLTRPGNAIRSEHLSRNLMDDLQDRAKTTENIPWGSDLREILVRYGWPTGWERIRPPTPLSDSPGMVSHYAGTDQKLLPSCELLTGRKGVEEAEWDVDDPRARAGYAIPLADSLARWIYPLEHQVAVFRRGDSAVVVAAYSLPADSFPAGASIRAGLALEAPDDSGPTLATRDSAGLEDAIAARFASGPALLSLELLSEPTRRVARAREGISIPPRTADELAVSDLLLLRSTDALPDSLAAAIPQARGSDRVRPGEPVGVYWEVYGLSTERPDLLTMSLRLLDRRQGVVRRLAERIGLLHTSDPIRMQWKEPPAADGLAARAIILEVPEELRPGTYTLELTVAAPGREPQVATRAMRVGEEEMER
jgi:hypothetical protein